MRIAKKERMIRGKWRGNDVIDVYIKGIYRRMCVYERMGVKEKNDIILVTGMIEKVRYKR